MLGIVGGLIVAEPDMGTTIIVLLTASTLFFVAGAPLSHLGLLIAVGGFISYMVVQQRDYQMDRLVSFVDPTSDPQGNGFQIIQLLIALGSGGPLGLGWARAGKSSSTFRARTRTVFSRSSARSSDSSG